MVYGTKRTAKRVGELFPAGNRKYISGLRPAQTFGGKSYYIIEDDYQKVPAWTGRRRPRLYSTLAGIRGRCRVAWRLR